jgi:hypothetical protein
MLLSHDLDVPCVRAHLAAGPRGQWPTLGTLVPKKTAYVQYVHMYVHTRSPANWFPAGLHLCALDYSRRGGNGGDIYIVDQLTAMYICTYKTCQAARTGAKSCLTGQLGDKDRPTRPTLARVRGQG